MDFLDIITKNIDVDLAVAVFFIVLIVIYMIYIRFSNDMTNVELLLCYWKEYLASVIIMAMCYHLFKNE